jgi:Protein of unknown function (DUF3667)
MSKKIIRKDKTCLNCRHVVENKFCPNCGQENSDTRKTFHHLFIHFFEDLTHYENAFWKTIKNLLFRPATLTKEYLSGKRLSYLAPVRLYIFISFIAFFIISLFPDKVNLENIKKDNIKSKVKKEVFYKNKGFSITKNPDEESEDEKNYNPYNYDSIKKAEEAKIPLTKEELEIKKILETADISKSAKDTLNKLINDKIINKKLDEKDFLNFGNFKNLKELDSCRKFGKGDDEISDLEYYLFKKVLLVKENNTKEEIFEKGKESILHNFPKVLLIYMPIFAFFLWIFHGKKRWYYFDHGIFTLHYFSFLLLIYLVIFVTTRFLGMLVENDFIKYLSNGIKLLGLGWAFYYFFPAHHRFYCETRWISFFKSIVLFYLNFILFLIIMVSFFIYTLINIH